MVCEHDEREIEILKERAEETLRYMRMSEEEKREYEKEVVRKFLETPWMWLE